MGISMQLKLNKLITIMEFYKINYKLILNKLKIAKT